MATANGFHRYTDEEYGWIAKHIDDGTYTEITEMFNSVFGTNINNICDVAKRLRLKKTINRGDVKKGERRCTNTLPIGTERYNGINVYVKVTNNINDCKNRRMPSKAYDLNWVRKDHLVWESHGNRLPKHPNEMLIHLNGDRQDCRIENLYLTDRKINLLMCKNGWHSTDRNVTLAGLKWCEMYYAMRDVGELPIPESVKQAKKEYHKKWVDEHREQQRVYKREYQRAYRAKAKMDGERREDGHD